MSLASKMRKARLHPELERNKHTVKNAERALLLLKKVKRDGNSAGECGEARPDSEDAQES